MRFNKLFLLAAIFVVTAFAGSALAAPLWILGDKEFYWIKKDQNNNNIGFMAEKHEKIKVAGEDALKSVRTIYDKKTNEMMTMEYVRNKEKPLIRLSIEWQDGKKVTGRLDGDNYVFTLPDGTKGKVARSEFDYFSCDEQNIYDRVPDGDSRTRKILDVNTGQIVKIKYQGKGASEMTLFGDKVKTKKYLTVEGATQYEVEVDPETMSALIIKSVNDGSKLKRVKKSELKDEFPGKLK